MFGSTSQKFYRCQCYYVQNYYIQDYGVHLEYTTNEEEFLQANKEALQMRGCNTDEKKSQVLDQIKVEYERRKNMDFESMKRSKKIHSEYTPLHEEIYTLKVSSCTLSPREFEGVLTLLLSPQEEYLTQTFLDIVKLAVSPTASHQSLLQMMKPEEASEVFRLPVFTKTFCEMFLEEIGHFEASKMPKGRPNTMNNNGVLLGELGFDHNFLTPLRDKYLGPVANILYPEWCGGGLNSHKAFTVKYEEGKDLDLGFHYDNAEVTLNVCLGKDFDDGSLYFGAMRQDNSKDRTTEVKHVTGEGILHRGQHRHGAMPITSGERVNIIVWMRSSTVRNSHCPMCDCEPILIPAYGYGDGFTDGEQREVEICNLY